MSWYGPNITNSHNNRGNLTSNSTSTSHTQSRNNNNGISHQQTGLTHQINHGISHQHNHGISHQNTNGISHQNNNGISHQNNNGISHQNNNGISHQQINGISHHNARNIDNTPAWMQQNTNATEDATRDNKSKKQRLFVMTGTLLNTISTTNLRQMPLSLDNNLPAATLRFGTNNENEVAFSCHLDSCAAMNTGNKLLHMWIMTTYPDIVKSYEQYDDENPFRPITLDCAVPTSAAEKEASKLSAVVTYITRYNDASGKPVTLSFGLGDDVTVNAIIGIPTFRAWKLILDISEDRAVSKLLNLFFDLDYKHAATGLPQGIKFERKDFVRPTRPNPIGKALVTRLTNIKTDDIALPNTGNDKTTIVQDNMESPTNSE